MSNSFKLHQSPIPFLDGNFPVGSEIGGQPIVVKRDPKVFKDVRENWCFLKRDLHILGSLGASNRDGSVSL